MKLSSISIPEIRHKNYKMLKILLASRPILYYTNKGAFFYMIRKILRISLSYKKPSGQDAHSRERKRLPSGNRARCENSTKWNSFSTRKIPAGAFAPAGTRLLLAEATVATAAAQQDQNPNQAGAATVATASAAASAVVAAAEVAEIATASAAEQ